jgi:hypothetical protein
LPDDQLSWFLAEQKVFARPRPLTYTLEIQGLVFGLTYALESIEFPLYAVRARQFRGRVYLAAVPSAMAESDLAQRLRNIHDQSQRFTRNLERAWEDQIKPELDRYNLMLEELAAFSGSSAEFAKKMYQLRRDRGNQWFAAIRGVVAPVVLLYQRAAAVDQGIETVVEDFLRSALERVRERGSELVKLAFARAGKRLASERVLEHANDVRWLEWRELCTLLQSPRDCRLLVAQRKSTFEHDEAAVAPATIGPALAQDAPRMYLIPEMLRALDVPL